MTTSTSIPTTSIPGGLNSSKDQLPAETSIPNVSRSPDEESLDDSEDDLQAVKPKLRLRVTNPDGDQSTDEDTGGDYTKDFLLPPSISSSTASPSLASVPVPNTYRKTQGHKTSEMSVSSSTTLNRRQSKVLEEAQSENNHSAIPTVVLDPLASPQQGQGRRNSTARMRMDGGPEKYSQQQHSGRNIPCLSSRMSDTSSVGRNAPLSPALTTTSSLQTSSNLAATMSPSNLSKYAKASYSLTNKPDNIKLYRSMAQKTNDISVQLMYAKYLLEIAGLYENTTQKKVSSVGSSIGAVIAPSSRASSNDSSQKKKRLQNEGVRWIKYLAGKNVGEAAYMQAQWMENCCYGLQKNPVKSFRLYCVAAEAGIPEAMYSIGLHYEKQGNYEKAVQSYKAAADIGLVEAIYRMANIHLCGECNQQQNMTVALALLSRASEEATASCPEPPYIFGLLLTNTYTKVNVPTPVIKQYGSAGDAPNYFDRAAQLGYVPAQTRMAYISENGLYGAPINLSKSFVYYAAAASQGDAHAMLGLSRLYNRGSRGPGDNNEEQLMAIDVSGWLASTVPNEDEAFQWCQRAAEKGIADALFLLGWYYEAGIGVLRNDEQANYYYGAAADKGHAVAVERMQRLNVTSRYRREEIPRTRRGKKKQKRRWRCLVM